MSLEWSRSRGVEWSSGRRDDCDVNGFQPEQDMGLEMDQ